MNVKQDSNTSASRRIAWIDTAKALAIIIMAWSHYSFYSMLNGVHNSAFEWFGTFDNYLVSSAMAAFFLMTGYTSSFTKLFGSFVVSQASALLLPALVFHFLSLWIDSLLTVPFAPPLHYGLHSVPHIILYGGIYWFLSALFLAKILHWCVLKWLPKRYICTFALASYAVGLALNMAEICLWNIQLSLMLYPFLCIGTTARNHGTLRLSAWAIPTFIGFSVVTYMCTDGFTGIQGGADITWKWAVPTLLLNAAGAYSILYVARHLPNYRIMFLLGSATLTIYCLHATFLNKCMYWWHDYLNSSGWAGGFVFTIVSLPVILTICLIFDYVLRVKKWPAYMAHMINLIKRL